MASREYIESRIDGKKKEIEKLGKKLERILKAQESNWVNNPYFYDEDDLRRTQRDLDKAKETLEKLEADLKATIEKDSSRNVEAIINFLEDWKERMRKFYLDSFEQYLPEREKRAEAHSEYIDWLNTEGWKASAEERNQREQAERQAKKAFNAKWNFIEPYVEYSNGGIGFNKAKLDKELDAEAKAKYDFIIERTNRIVGQITDATNLHIGEKGDLNGYIYGTQGTAKVQTIGAGGYNIQCFHFRTLITRA